MGGVKSLLFEDMYAKDICFCKTLKNSRNFSSISEKSEGVRD